jgi:hypothetical protein
MLSVASQIFQGTSEQFDNSYYVIHTTECARTSYIRRCQIVIKDAVKNIRKITYRLLDSQTPPAVSNHYRFGQIGWDGFSYVVLLDVVNHVPTYCAVSYLGTLNHHLRGSYHLSYNKKLIFSIFYINAVTHKKLRHVR